MKNYYKILELDPMATSEEIQAQYKLLLHAWHPDKFPDGELKKVAHEKILEINEAYNTLGNSAKKYSYDKKYNDLFRSTHSSNNQFKYSKENTETGNKNQTKPTKASKENIPYPSKRINSPRQIIAALTNIAVWIIIVTIPCIFLYNTFLDNSNNRELKEPTFSPVDTIIPTSTLTPVFTVDPLALLRNRCMHWTGVDASLLGETICVFGEIVTFDPKEEIRVPEIGSEWRWYFYFSYNNKDFFISYYAADFEFPITKGCIEITSELKANKTNALYLDIYPDNWKQPSQC